jgi:hypothetical protein
MATISPPPPVPTGLEVPTGHRPFLLGHASGTQNCIYVSFGPGFVWTFSDHRPPWSTTMTDKSSLIF